MIESVIRKWDHFVRTEVKGVERRDVGLLRIDLKIHHQSIASVYLEARVRSRDEGACLDPAGAANCSITNRILERHSDGRTEVAMGCGADVATQEKYEARTQ